MQPVSSRLGRLLAALLVGGTFLGSTIIRAADPQTSQLRQLSEFGDVGSKKLAETYQNAIAEMREAKA